MPCQLIEGAAAEAGLADLCCRSDDKVLAELGHEHDKVLIEQLGEENCRMRSVGPED
jgi:hypothetical protein